NCSLPAPRHSAEIAAVALMPRPPRPTRAIGESSTAARASAPRTSEREISAMRNRLLAAGLIAALAVGTAPLSAKTFRWANDGDVISMDPYARQETTLLSFMANIYEPLIHHHTHPNLDPAF